MYVVAAHIQNMPIFYSHFNFIFEYYTFAEISFNEACVRDIAKYEVPIGERSLSTRTTFVLINLILKVLNMLLDLIPVST